MPALPTRVHLALGAAGSALSAAAASRVDRSLTRRALCLRASRSGTTTGYDQAVALPAMQAGGDEGMFKENNKKFEVRSFRDDNQAHSHPSAPRTPFSHSIGPSMHRCSTARSSSR